MSVIIRLQNLPWSANAMDIRTFFSGLSIPEGGVHIVGGELGDAFIAFSTDEDARQAFNRNGGKIKEVQVKLMLSSRTEMQRVIEQARNQSMAAFMLPGTNAVPPMPGTIVPAAVPQVAAIPTPAAVPEIKRERSVSRDRDTSDRKRDKKRSRSKSRDRSRERSRDRDRKDRDRKYRDRSRSRSRDRSRRSRRNRSKSRARDRSKSRDRRNRDSRGESRDNKTSGDERSRDGFQNNQNVQNENASGFQNIQNERATSGFQNIPQNIPLPTIHSIQKSMGLGQVPGGLPQVWASPQSDIQAAAGILGALNPALTLDQAKRALVDNLGVINGLGATPPVTSSFSAIAPNQRAIGRESWPPTPTNLQGNFPPNSQGGFQRGPENNFGNPRPLIDDPRGGRDRLGDPRRNRDLLDDPRGPRDNRLDNGPRGPRDNRLDNDPRGPRDSRLNTDPRGLRDNRLDNDPRGSRDNRLDNDPRGPRDNRDGPRGSRNDHRGPRDHHNDFGGPRDMPNDYRGPRDFPNEPRNDFRGPRDLPNDPRGPRGLRDLRDEVINPRDLMSRPNMDIRDDPRMRDEIVRDPDDLRNDLNQRRMSKGNDFGEERKINFEPSPHVNTCVSVEPFYGGYADIRKFFKDLYISFKGIKIIHDDMGQKVGKAYVQFSKLQDKMDAIQRTGFINNCEILVQPISDEEFDRAVDRYHPKRHGSKEEQRNERAHPEKPPVDIPEEVPRFRNITAKFFNKPNPDAGSPKPEDVKPALPAITDFVCLKIEELPQFVKEQDILHMFSQHPLISLHLVPKSRGMTAAYVKFSSKDVAQIALNEKQHHIVLNKQVSVKPCTEEEFEEINDANNIVSNNSNNIKDEKPNANVLESDCLSVNNLPTKTNDRDISDFFSDIGVIPTKIHLMSNNMGFTGQAYCEFDNIEEAKNAATKDQTVLGSNTVNVKMITREEMMGILGNALPHPGPVLPPPGLKIEPPEGLKLEDNLIPPLAEGGVPLLDFRGPLPGGNNGSRDPRDDLRHREDDFGPRGDEFDPRDDPFDPHGPLMDDRFDHRGNFGPRGGGFGPRGGGFGPRGGGFGPRGGDFGSRGGDFGPRGGDFGPRSSFNGGPRGFGPRGSGNRGGRGGRFPPRGVPDSSNFDDAPPGCTVFMDNVPYKASTNDILDFFEGYNHTSTVSRRYNPDNTPSPEAKITFFTPEEAYKAVHDLDGRKIWMRSIRLSQI